MLSMLDIVRILVFRSDTRHGYRVQEAISDRHTRTHTHTHTYTQVKGHTQVQQTSNRTSTQTIIVEFKNLLGSARDSTHDRKRQRGKYFQRTFGRNYRQCFCTIGNGKNMSQTIKNSEKIILFDLPQQVQKINSRLADYQRANSKKGALICIYLLYILKAPKQRSSMSRYQQMIIIHF